MRVYEIGPFRLNAEQLLLTHEHTPVGSIGPKVVETLLALIDHPGEVLTKRSLMERVWPEGFVEEANLTQNIHALRKAFLQVGDRDPIETVPRRGYRLVAPVRQVRDVPGAFALLPTPRRSRAAIAFVTIIFAGAFLGLGAASGFGHRDAARSGLSEKGARLYQIGRYYWNLRTRDGVRKSLIYFTRVIDTDPSDARGYAALAQANVTMGDYCYGTHRPAVYYARAREYARKALSFDASSVEAHAALGVLALDRKDTNLALAELRRAIALDSSYAPAQEWYGIALLRRGQISDGAAHLKTAADLDPLSVSTTAWLGTVAYRQRRFEDAIAYSRQALELAPNRADVLATLGKAYEQRGNFKGALDAFEKYGSIDLFYRPEAAALLAGAYAELHRMPEARFQYSYARAHAKEVDPADLAAAALAVGANPRPQTNGRAHHAATYA